jgi:hypothetical protein
VKWLTIVAQQAVAIRKIANRAKAATVAVAAASNSTKQLRSATAKQSVTNKKGGGRPPSFVLQSPSQS